MIFALWFTATLSEKLEIKQSSQRYVVAVLVNQFEQLAFFDA